MIIHLMNKDILIPTSLLTNFKASRKHLVIKPLGSKAALNQKDLTPPCGDRRSQSRALNTTNGRERIANSVKAFKNLFRITSQPF